MEPVTRRLDGSGLVDPVDPRLSSPSPPQLDGSTVLDDATRRIVAPNPSLMTLDGTNTYVVGAKGAGEAVIVDPGPRDADHVSRITQALADLDAECRLVMVTHHHLDHSEGAGALAAELGCRVAAANPAVAGPTGVVVSEGHVTSVGPISITTVATPGHCADHLAFRLGHGPLLTGDHILGRGTSVVAAPDGNMAAYLASLRRVLDLSPGALFPGHGPEMSEDVEEIVRYYLAHREFREAQILSAVSSLPGQTVAELARRIYTAVDPSVLFAAEKSTLAGVEKLASEGRLRVDGGRVFPG